MENLRSFIRKQIKTLLESSDKQEKYCAIILTPESQDKLIEATKQFYETPWESALSKDGKEKYAHHMTISYDQNLGDLNLEENKEIQIKVIAIGSTDKAMAVKVEKPFKQMTITPHISIATNRAKGGSRINSNDITKWKSIKPITLKGHLKNKA